MRRTHSHEVALEHQLFLRVRHKTGVTDTACNEGAPVEDHVSGLCREGLVLLLINGHSLKAKKRHAEAEVEVGHVDKRQASTKLFTPPEDPIRHAAVDQLAESPHRHGGIAQEGGEAC